MQLTGVDETDLLLPLYAGVHDQAEWKTFLMRVQRRTDADYASLIFAQGDTPIHLSKEVFAGRNLREEARALGVESLYDMGRLPYDRLRPGRVYHMAEFTSIDAQSRAFHENYNRQMGLSDERIVRIKEQEGTSAWLMLARNQGVFSAADSALLAAVAPHVAVALRSFVLSERDRIRAAASSDGLSRAGVGWIALGRDARIIDLDPKLAPLLRDISGATALVGDRLHVDSPAARDALLQAAATFAAHPDALPRALTLREEPRLEALLVPMAERAEATLAVPVMLAFCRVARPADHDRKAVLRELFGLSAREAELALAMSEGQSIGEAAAAMGLTNETARGYSKNIYAKMGVRGQAELVRQIFMSSAALA